MYCETEEETQKDRLPKDERVPIPGLETKQSGSLRHNEQIELESRHHHHDPSMPHPRQYNRSMHENGMPASQPRGFAQAFSSGGRRVAPGKQYDEANG